MKDRVTVWEMCADLSVTVSDDSMAELESYLRDVRETSTSPMKYSVSGCQFQVQTEAPGGSLLAIAAYTMNHRELRPSSLTMRRYRTTPLT